MRILVVDDEPQLVRALAINLKARDYEVHTAATATARDPPLTRASVQDNR